MAPYSVIHPFVDKFGFQIMRRNFSIYDNKQCSESRLTTLYTWLIN